MNKASFVSYLKTLKPEDWNRQVTDEWTVKEVVAHLIGWEKYDPDAIKKTWNTKELPWWRRTENYDEFNQKNVEYYRNYTPNQLIEELEEWQRRVQEEIDRIGESNLRARPDLFGWLFDETDASHYNYHYQQIKDVVEK